MSKSLNIKDLDLSFDLFKKDFILIRKKSEFEISLHQISQALHSRQLPFIDEVISTEVEILLKLNDKFTSKHLLALSQIKINQEEQINKYYLPVYFSEHDDWSRIVDHTGLSKQNYINKLLSLDLSVSMLGFLPGFIYINALPKEMQCPRKESPSIKTNKNSFAIAEHYCGIYSLESPGGWNVIGEIPCDIISFPELPPVLVKPGDKLHIRSISLDEFNKLNNSNINILEYNASI